MPGLVALVSHHDDVHVETLGTLAFDNPAPMKRDTIFRIASITKLITAVAAMILVEECKLRLDDSIEPWLPELANRRVLKSIASELDDTVPASRCDHRSRSADLPHGLRQRDGDAGHVSDPEVDPRISDRRRRPDRCPRRRPPWTNGSSDSARCPCWHNRASAGCITSAATCSGALIARVSGQSLGTFMRERIFDPLGHERHRLPRASREDRSPARVSTSSIARRTSWSSSTTRQTVPGAPSHPSNRAEAVSSRRSMTTSPSAA